MEKNGQKYYYRYDRSEVNKCLLCQDPACTKACPQKADVGAIIRSLFFKNFLGATKKLTCDCTYCNAPCEKVCVAGIKKAPVAIRELMLGVKSEAPSLPAHVIEDVDLSTDICGVPLENPFLLSSSVVASTYDMCKRAFEAGKNTGVGGHALLQGIFPTKGSNPGLLHCRRILYHLSHQGSLI